MGKPCRVDSVVREATDEEFLALSVTQPEVFAVLVKRYRARLLCIAMQICHSREDGEDATQEALMRIYNHRADFQRAPVAAPFKSWAYKVTINTAITHRNRRKAESAKFLNADDEMAKVSMDMRRPDPPVDLVRLIGEQNQVEMILAQMPEHLAEVLRLHYLEEYSYKAIARRLGISLCALKMRMFRARAHFAKVWFSRQKASPVKREGSR